MTHLDIFSGIGGFALAALWSGIETVAFCEIDPFCQKILNKNFPNIPIHKDVRDKQEFNKYSGAIDIITGGYPCQPFSVAGKQRGAEDDRHLWPSMLEIIKRVRPTWVLAENVTGHIKLGLDEVLADMAREGYSTRTIIVPACAIDAPHRRDRLWIIGHSNNHGTSTTKKREGFRTAVQDLTEGENQMRQSKGATIFYPNTRSERGEGGFSKAFQRKPSLSWCKDCRSIEDWRRLPDLLQPLLPRGNHGIPHRMDRTRGIGNAIVPQVAFKIMKLIKQEHERFEQKIHTNA